MAKPRVVVAGTLPEAGLELLRGRYDVEVAGDVPRDSLFARLPGATAIVAPTRVRVDGEMLEAAGSSLKVVAGFGVGYDNIDLDAVHRLGLRATNTPNVLTAATAELAVALMLAAGRRVAEGDAVVRGGGSSRQLVGRSLVGATVGIVGFGRIGQCVANLLRGFEAHILFADEAMPDADHGAERTELSQLLALSDFVTLHVPLAPGTRHLIDAGALARMKPGAILVNTSRGGIVDTAALIDAPRSGRLAAAGLDVFETEPDVPHELRELPNTVLTPHIGSATGATRDAMARLAAANVIAVIEGREPPAPVV
jgi:lactate dehydrogenase-like 2-hydroxyacid dehydrogenase